MSRENSGNSVLGSLAAEETGETAIGMNHVEEEERPEGGMRRAAPNREPVCAGRGGW